MSDLMIVALVIGIFVLFALAGRLIYRADDPSDAEFARRDRLYLVIVLAAAISFPILIYDNFKISRWVFGG